MSLQRNYYEVLGLPPGATTDQIKKKYRELARQYHPDVIQDKNLGQRVFSQINQAYSVLGNPERRAQYNGTLQNAPAPEPPKPASQAARAPQPAPQAPPAPAAAPKSAAPRSPAFAEMLTRAEHATMAGKPVEARAFCVRILEADPRNVRALEILGDSLAAMGRREEAAVSYRQALQAAPSPMIQAKLNRIAEPAQKTRTIPPYQAPSARPAPAQNGTSAAQGGAKNGAGTQSGNGTHRPDSAAGTPSEPEKSGGLLGRLLKRK